MDRPVRSDFGSSPGGYLRGRPRRLPTSPLKELANEKRCSKLPTLRSGLTENKNQERTHQKKEEKLAEFFEH